MTQSDQSNSQRKSYMCLVQYVLHGSTMYGIPFMWQASSAAEAAQQAGRLGMWPDAQRHRITVVELEHAETFQWLGEGEVRSERVG